MMNKRAPRRSDEEWHQIILAARASGLSDFEYCRDNSIQHPDQYILPGTRSIETAGL